VPAGRFWWAAAEGDGQAYDDEKPGHEVPMVSRFKIQRWPVTVEEFSRFVDDEGYGTQKHWLDADGWEWRLKEGVEAPEDWSVQRAGPWNVPVTGVSWWEAMAYCRWLTERKGRALEPGWVIRLPTETEWEKSARGGEVLAGGANNPEPQRRYPWQGEWAAGNANVDGRIGHVTPVGCFPGGHGPYETWDQAGNVWEWCLDWFHPEAYPLYLRERERKPDPVVLSEVGVPEMRTLDPQGKPVTARCRGCRGGGWAGDAQDARVSLRIWSEPWEQLDSLGFRCVAAPP
jgi:formylglycine-generating enzyme required for sulfatase activity